MSTSIQNSVTGTVTEVQKSLGLSISDNKAGATPRQAQLVDATLGAVQGALKGLPNDAQVTLTASIEEDHQDGKHRVTKVYLDLTVVPAALADAPVDVPASVPTPAPAG